MMDELDETIARVAADSGFSGAVRVDRNADGTLAQAYGLANRASGVRNAVNTVFGIASGTKGFTALAMVSLIEDGVLGWDTRARDLLGPDVPFVDDAVTVAQLLAHRSGIGDYLDESLYASDNDYVLPVDPRELATTEDYLKVLDGHPQAFPPGERFSYCNGGYVVLALVAERASGMPFPELVRTRVCEPAGLRRTGFLRLDDLPRDAATGYLAAEGAQTNVGHLPVVGSGDGGIFSTLEDLHALWRAFAAGRIVSPANVQAMTRPRSEHGARRYGLGFWLAADGPAVVLEGADAGVSFMSVHDPVRDLTWTVVSNVTEAAWPLARHLVATL